MTPFVFYKTEEKLPDRDVHKLGNDIQLLCRGGDVAAFRGGQYSVMTYDGDWWDEDGTELANRPPAEWAYIEVNYEALEPPVPYSGRGLPDPSMTPYVFRSTGKVLPDRSVHGRGNVIELLCTGDRVSQLDGGRFTIMLFGAYDEVHDPYDNPWSGSTGGVPEAWAYVESWPLVEHPTGHVNYAAPNQQLRGYIIRPTEARTML